MLRRLHLPAEFPVDPHSNHVDRAGLPDRYAFAIFPVPRIHDQHPLPARASCLRSGSVVDDAIVVVEAVAIEDGKRALASRRHDRGDARSVAGPLSSLHHWRSSRSSCRWPRWPALPVVFISSSRLRSRSPSRLSSINALTLSPASRRLAPPKPPVRNEEGHIRSLLRHLQQVVSRSSTARFASSA